MNPLPDYLERELQQLFTNAVRIQQNEWEIRTFLNRVLTELKPVTTIELGTWLGNNAALLSLVTSGETLSLDKQEYGSKQQAIDIAQRNNRKLTFAIADGHKQETVDRFRRPVDLLFVDDGHCIDEVTADHKLWGPLVRPGGWIAFHDINFGANQCAPGVHPDICQAHAYWAKLTGDKEEIIFPGDPKSPGIGILHV